MKMLGCKTTPRTFEEKFIKRRHSMDRDHEQEPPYLPPEAEVTNAFLGFERRRAPCETNGASVFGQRPRCSCGPLRAAVSLDHDPWVGHAQDLSLQSDQSPVVVQGRLSLCDV